MLSGYGVASVLVFRSKAFQFVKLVEDADMTRITKIIVNKSTHTEHLRETLMKSVSVAGAVEACIPSLLKLLNMLLPKLNKTISAILIGKIIISVITNRATSLQMALGTDTD